MRVCILDRAGGRRGPLRRAADWLWYRLASETMIQSRGGRRFAAAIARVVAERGIEVLEMEETRGVVELVRQAVRIPVTVRLQGPWFVNGPAIGA